MDGWVVIGTDLDSKEFDKEMKRLQKESEKFAKEEEQLLNKKAKLEIDVNKTMGELTKVDKKIDLINKKMSTIEANNIPENLETNITYQKLLADAEQLNIKGQEYADKLELQKTNLNNINTKLKENVVNQELIKNKLEETEAKSLGLHMNFSNIGKSINDNIKKVGKWIMAVFSLRTAYATIQNAMSIISGYNDGINNKLYSMKMMFATALEPLITRIVNLAWKLMGYINYIAKAWFGVDLASKASANSMKAGAKSAKEMRKTLTGFDEATVLNDNGTTSNTSTTSPKFETPNVEIPSWIKWIGDNKETILDFFKQLGVIIGTIKIAQLLLKLRDTTKLLKDMSGLKIFGIIAGLALTITGIVTATKGVIAFIKDPSWENFNKILEGLTLTLLGVGTAMVALNTSNPVGWVMIASGAITGLVTVCSGLTKSFFENKAGIKSVKDAQEELTKAQKNAKKAQEDLTNSVSNHINAVERAEEVQKNLTEIEKKNKVSGEELQKQVDEGTLSYETMTEKQREVYKAYQDNITAQDNLRISTENLETAKKNKIATDNEEIKKGLEVELSNGKQAKSYDNFKNSVVTAYNEGKISAEEARDLIEKAMSDMSGASKQTFMTDLPNDIKNGLEPSKYDSAFKKLKTAFSDAFESIKSAFASIWKTITGKANEGIKVRTQVSMSELPGSNKVFRNAKGAIIYPKLQYHANGGIINRPGRGVPITQHIGGERGAEGIVPLTDSQQMELLGQAIGRYITVNATVINSMNGRVLSKELQKIQTERDFEFNR